MAKAGKTMLETCEEAIRWAGGLMGLSYKGEQQMYHAGTKSIEIKLAEALDKLYEKDYYKEDALNRAIDNLIEKLKQDIMGEIAENSKLKVQEKKILAILSEFRVTKDKIVAGSKKREIMMRNEDYQETMRTLERLNPLLAEELDIREVQTALATKIRKIARALEKEVE